MAIFRIMVLDEPISESDEGHLHIMRLPFDRAELHISDAQGRARPLVHGRNRVNAATWVAVVQSLLQTGLGGATFLGLGALGTQSMQSIATIIMPALREAWASDAGGLMHLLLLMQISCKLIASCLW